METKGTIDTVDIRDLTSFRQVNRIHLIFTICLAVMDKENIRVQVNLCPIGLGRSPCCNQIIGLEVIYKRHLLRGFQSGANQLVTGCVCSNQVLHMIVATKLIVGTQPYIGVCTRLDVYLINPVAFVAERNSVVSQRVSIGLSDSVRSTHIL